MTEDDRAAFAETIQQVYDYHTKPLSKGVLNVWWTSLKGFDLLAIQDALGRHAVNPDTGQFCPKVADVVKFLQGTSLDGALLAWAKVERAIRQVGPWNTVVFDDALIHRVIDDMGGWVALNNVKDDEFPFRAREFENRYRGFAHRMMAVEYPSKLLGISESNNSSQGKTTDRNGVIVDNPVLLGDPAKAQAVLSGGSASGRLTVTPLAALALQVLPKEAAQNA